MPLISIYSICHAEYSFPFTLLFVVHCSIIIGHFSNKQVSCVSTFNRTTFAGNFNSRCSSLLNSPVSQSLSSSITRSLGSPPPTHRTCNCFKLNLLWLDRTFSSSILSGWEELWPTICLRAAANLYTLSIVSGFINIKPALPQADSLPRHTVYCVYCIVLTNKKRLMTCATVHM